MLGGCNTFMSVPPRRGKLRLQAPAETTALEVDTYIKVAGVFSDGYAKGFVIVDNALVWKGVDGMCFLLNGVADLRVSKVCTLTLALFKNGELVTGAETPHVFTSPAKTSNLSITDLIMLNQNDSLDVYVKVTDPTAIITVESMSLTFWGGYK